MNGQILVTGAPGNVGSEVVRALIGKAAVRVGAWDVEAARLAFDPLVEVVRFDFLDPATFQSAFGGVDRLFLVRPPALANVERQIAPAICAAVAAGVKHIVFLSLQGVEHNRITPHYKIEQLILSLGVDYTFLRASFFMQNLSTTHRDEIRETDEISLPVGQARTSFIDVRDIGAVAAVALSGEGHTNQIYTLTGAEALTYDEVAAFLSGTLGRSIHYAPCSPMRFLLKQARRKRPLGYALVMTLLYTITRMGNARTVTDDVQRVLGRAPISFRQFAEDYRACWVI